MKPYPKNIYQTAALIQKYKDAGLVITDDQKVETALNEIGFYRLRGYSFHLYDNATKKYIPNVAFDTICHIYNFDMELRSLLFGMTCKIEVALRSRFCEALLQKNDALIYLDPSIFKDKAIFWRNTASISSEIARSTDVFITHNYDNHDGQIPLWAAVEVMSFGTLSKYIKNLSTGTDSVYPSLAQFYKYTCCISFFESITLFHPHIFIANVASIPLWIKTNLRRVAQRQSTVGLNSPSIFICCSFLWVKTELPKASYI